MPLTGQIQWNPTPNEQEVTTTMTFTCRNGRIYAETPASQGGFAADFGSSQEAAQSLAQMFDLGLQQAGHGSV